MQLLSETDQIFIRKNVQNSNKIPIFVLLPIEGGVADGSFARRCSVKVRLIRRQKLSNLIIVNLPIELRVHKKI